MKKALKFLSSMRFALILLLILIIACAAGSLVTQNQTLAWYTQRYSERTAALLVAAGLDDVFHSWWFIVITAFLCINLFLCNLVRLPSLVRRFKEAADPTCIAGAQAAVSLRCRGSRDEVKRLFEKTGFSWKEGPDGSCFAQKQRIGLWGAWVCHLGILIVILGFGLGQILKQEYSVYGVPGQSKPIGDTPLILTIDDFTVDLRDDDTVRQYRTDFTVRNASDGTSRSGSTGVNAPCSLYGMRFYQNSTGWAADIHILKDGELLQEETVCAGDFTAVSDKPELVIYLNAFYPDYVLEEGTPKTRSSDLNNPAYLYSVYYQGRMLGMNALMQEEELTIDEYTVTFSDPRSYTLIQIKRDPFTPAALIGGLLTLAGLFLAFYLQAAWIRACRVEEDEWLIEAASRKGGAIFNERLKEEAQCCGLMIIEGEEKHEP